jgi:CheY-like chemotaxis protein
VIEDDAAIRESLRELLTDEGFCVCEAENGQEALRLLHEDGLRPCHILLDLMMPVMNGWQFMESACRELKAAQIPLTVLSAVADKQKIPAGVNHMRKPVDIEALLGVLDRTCAKLPPPANLP